MKKADIGLIGLAVMGENLIMNMESKGFTVACYNRTVEKVDAFVNGRAKGKNIIGCHSIQELADNLEKPRKVFCMVKAGAAVDAMIEQLLGVLEPGDIIIDGGNSHFPDTIRRTQYVESKGLLYVGTGVSGGEEGALKGPSMMPGGSPAAWPYVKPIFQGICAKVEDGSPCCDWVGENGAGHFVKMVHNGIEYGDMQLICESYQLMRDLLGMSDDEMHEVFKQWNTTELDSYLIEITRDILAYKDTDGSALVENILDTAGQKGTGKWTGIAALDEGVPLTLIGEAVFARCLSAMKAERRQGLQPHDSALHWRQGRVRRGHPPGTLRLEDHLLRAGLHAHAHRREDVRLEPQLRRHRAYVARRLHHPQRVPREDQGGVRQGPRAFQPPARPVLQGDDREARARVAPGGRGGRLARHPRAGDDLRTCVLRRLHHGAPSGEPPAGAARLLRRAHVRAARFAPRTVLPHELDRPRRQHLRRDVQRLVATGTAAHPRARTSL